MSKKGKMLILIILVYIRTRFKTTGVVYNIMVLWWLLFTNPPFKHRRGWKMSSGVNPQLVQLGPNPKMST